MVLEILQFLGGAIMFAATGYAITLAFFDKKELDALEQVVFSIAFALVIPTLVLILHNQDQ